MTWVRLDDLMPDHPKVAPLSNRAFRVHIHGLCYSARALTDGYIPAIIAHRLCPGGRRAADELVEAGIWARIGDGYEIHDFSEYQQSREHVLEQRAKTADRVARWRDMKRDRNGVTTPVSNGVSNAAPDPTRPLIPLTPQSGEQELEKINPRDAGTNPRANGTNPRAVKKQTKAQRSHLLHVMRTRDLYEQWLAEPGADPNVVSEQIRNAYPDIAAEVLGP